jgi:hypothetical protein
MANIYVAGKLQESHYVRHVMTILEGLGHTISYDWTTLQFEHNHARCAINELNGIKECDYLIAMVYRKLNYRGVLVEIGAALALDKPVYIFGEGLNGCIFTSLCRLGTDLEDLPL